MIDLEPSEPLFVAAVSVFVVRGERLLALKRSVRKDAAPGAWDAVSGRVRAGEHPYDAAVRESREETGLAVAVDPAPIVSYTARRLEHPMLVVAYRGEAPAGDVVLSDEHDESAWMTVEEFARACPFPLLVDAARRAMARRAAAAAIDRAGAAAPPATHVILWEFRVPPDSAPAFEAAYGPDGDWARLFRKAPGYLGTDLLRATEPARYLTVDRWATRADFEAFKSAHREEYDALDRRCEALTERETPLGVFAPLPAR